MRMMARLLTEPLSRAHAPSDFAQRVVMSLPRPRRLVAPRWAVWAASAAVVVSLAFGLWRASQPRARRDAPRIVGVEPQRKESPKASAPDRPNAPRESPTVNVTPPKSPAAPPSRYIGTPRRARRFTVQTPAPSSNQPVGSGALRSDDVDAPVTFHVRWGERSLEQQETTITARQTDVGTTVIERPPLLTEALTVTVTTNVETANGS
jgi:hypothetical protein